VNNVAPPLTTTLHQSTWSTISILALWYCTHQSQQNLGGIQVVHIPISPQDGCYFLIQSPASTSKWSNPKKYRVSPSLRHRRPGEAMLAVKTVSWKYAVLLFRLSQHLKTPERCLDKLSLSDLDFFQSSPEWRCIQKSSAGFGLRLGIG